MQKEAARDDAPEEGTKCEMSLSWARTVAFVSFSR
jgi:hypothetical protein